MRKWKVFWDESGLGLTSEEKAEIKRLGDHNGQAIADEKYRQEREQYYKDLYKELDSNLNPKSW